MASLLGRQPSLLRCRWLTGEVDGPMMFSSWYYLGVILIQKLGLETFVAIQLGGGAFHLLGEFSSWNKMAGTRRMQPKFNFYKCNQRFFCLLKCSDNGVWSHPVEFNSFWEAQETLSSQDPTPFPNTAQVFFMVTFIFYKQFKFDRPPRTPLCLYLYLFLIFWSACWCLWVIKLLCSLWYLLRPRDSTLPVSSTRLELWKRKQLPYRSSLVCHWNGKGWREGCWLLLDNYYCAEASSCLSPTAHQPNKPW